MCAWHLKIFFSFTKPFLTWRRLSSKENQVLNILYSSWIKKDNYNSNKEIYKKILFYFMHEEISPFKKNQVLNTHINQLTCAIGDWRRVKKCLAWVSLHSVLVNERRTRSMCMYITVSMTEKCILLHVLDLCASTSPSCPTRNSTCLVSHLWFCLRVNVLS